MLGFAVNDGSGRFARVLAHAFPDTHDVATSGVDNLATDVFDLLQSRKLGAESGHDDDIVRTKVFDVGLLVFAEQVLDA